MTPKAIVFDLFHTLTGFESEWSDLPFTCDVLGIDRRVWNKAITTGSRWRLAGEERDAYRILHRLAREIDPRITEETIRKAAELRIRRFRDALQRIPPANVETLKALRRAGFAVGLISNADAIEIAPWKDSPLAGLFDVEVFSCECGHVKPEAEIYRLCLERRHLQAAASGIDDEAVLLEQTQRLQHRLARDSERRSDLLLGEPRAGRQLPVADGVQQPLVDLFGQVGGVFDPIE